jgi:hypothetical protein
MMDWFAWSNHRDIFRIYEEYFVMQIQYHNMYQYILDDEDKFLNPIIIWMDNISSFNKNNNDLHSRILDMLLLYNENYQVIYR